MLAPSRPVISPDPIAGPKPGNRKPEAGMAAGRAVRAFLLAGSRCFAEETKPVSTGTRVRTEDRVVLRVVVLIRLTRFCWDVTWGET
jgi:hypothetical protein